MSLLFQRPLFRTKYYNMCVYSMERGGEEGKREWLFRVMVEMNECNNLIRLAGKTNHFFLVLISRCTQKKRRKLTLSNH